MDPALQQLRQVPIESVLQDRQLLHAFRSLGDRRLVGPCPIHPGADNPTAFVVDRIKNLWYCFSRCHRGGDVIELVRQLDGLSFRQALEYLAHADRRWAAELPRLHKQDIQLNRPPFSPYTRRLPLLTEHDRFRQLGLDPRTLEHFEAGVYPHPTGFLAGCLGVRLHDTDGRPVGYMGRRLDPQQIARYGKWKVPPGLPKATLLYNWHRATDRHRLPLVITEGPWAVMKLHQAGFTNVVALLGLRLSSFHRQLLSTSPSPILLLDGDPAGVLATKRILATLGPAARNVELPPDVDPDDLTEGELAHLLRPHCKVQY